MYRSLRQPFVSFRLSSRRRVQLPTSSQMCKHQSTVDRMKSLHPMSAGGIPKQPAHGFSFKAPGNTHCPPCAAGESSSQSIRSAESKPQRLRRSKSSRYNLSSGATGYSAQGQRFSNVVYCYSIKTPQPRGTTPQIPHPTRRQSCNSERSSRPHVHSTGNKEVRQFAAYGRLVLYWISTGQNFRHTT